MRESWTDERLDDPKEQMNGRFGQGDRRFDRIDAVLGELRRLMFQGFVASITITVTCFLGLAGPMAVG